MPTSRRSTLIRVAVALLLLVLAAWLASGRAVHYGQLASAHETPEPQQDSTVAVDRVTLRTTTGRELVCLLRRAAGDSSRALVVAGGQRTGRRAALLVSPRFGGAVLACDYPWSHRLRRSAAGHLLGAPRLRAELRASPEALRIAGEYLGRRPGTAPPQVVAVGVSLGALIVPAWAARDSLPTAVALIYGGAGLGRLADLSMRRTGTPAWLARPVGWVAGWALASLDPDRTVGHIAPRPVLIVGATDDERIPRDAVERLAAAASEPKRVVWLSGAHVRTSNEELISALGDTALVWLNALPSR